MVPSFFIEVDEMPLSPNGKIDRRALPRPSAPAEDAPERTDPEDTTSVRSAIVDVWSDVFGIDSISIHDNFFDLGGDSILSIRIVAGLRRAGIRVKPRDLFDHPTIVDLEKVADTEAISNPARPRLVGPAPLLPMQRWFFEQSFAEPDHWNQTMWFEASQPLDAQVLERALGHVLDHHDALRARFVSDADSWTQEILHLAPNVKPQEFRNLNETAEAAVVQSIEASLDIERGELVGAAIFTTRDRADRLMLTVHHLAIDGVSWRPLIEDLTTAYTAVSADRDVRLPARTSSVADWAVRVESLPPHPHWAELAERLPEPTVARRAEAEGQRLSVSVEAGRIDGLLDRLLASIGHAHREVFGWDRITTTLEGHGRAEELADDVDLSRTIGWFTAMYPIDADLEDASEGGLAEVPLGGVGALAVIDRMPRLVVNYLGRVDRSVAGTELLTPISGILAGYGPGNHRTHDLGILAHVAEGQLHVTWDFVPEQHPVELIERTIQAFVRHFTPETVGPSFDLVDLSASDLDAIAGLLD
jgi:aryl carrier-like protein